MLTSWRFGLALCLLAALAAGCSNDQPAGSSGGAAPTAANSTVIQAAGGTFPAPLYQKWFQEYQGKTGIAVNYQPIGSGGGIKDITSKTVDFGASDAPMSDAELAKATGVVHIPTVAGAVTIAYNLPGVQTGLKLDGPTIAGMFAGTITKWNDPAIAGQNPGVKLPAVAVVPFHRSDGSGTTNIFTTYLSEVDSGWKTKVGAGKSVRWPKGLGGKGNSGVAALVQQTQGGVGYVELAYAVTNKITYATVKNQSGQYVVPSVASTTSAVAGVAMPADFRKVAVNTTAKDGYPIAGFTFILVYPDCKPDVKKLLQWALTDGQKDAAAMYYAPLPASVDKAALDKISAFT